MRDYIYAVLYNVHDTDSNLTFVDIDLCCPVVDADGWEILADKPLLTVPGYTVYALLEKFGGFGCM